MIGAVALALLAAPPLEVDLELLEGLELDEPVLVEGEPIPARDGRRCAYREWVVGGPAEQRPEGGPRPAERFAWFGRPMAAFPPLRLRIGARAIELSPGQVRLFLSPVAERAFTRLDELPVGLRRLAAQAKGPYVVAEYCLEIGQLYPARLHRTVVPLPAKDGGPSSQALVHRVLWLGERPFLGPWAEVDPTPYFRTEPSPIRLPTFAQPSASP